MSLEIEAVYEDGVLKPEKPLPLQEHQRVTVSVQPTSEKRRQRSDRPAAFGKVPGCFAGQETPRSCERLPRIADDPKFGDPCGGAASSNR